MPETPFPTTEQIQTDGSLVTGDIAAAHDEIIRRIRTSLPDLIADEKTRRGWTGNQAIPVPVAYGIAPGDVTDSHVGHVLVGMQATKQALGAGNFLTNLTVAVYIVDQRIVADQQIRVYWTRGELVEKILFQYLTGCVNADDVTCWAELFPTGLTMLAEEYKNYAGVIVNFRLTQSPQMN